MIKPLTSIATNLSPGVATAAAQKNLTKKEQNQLAAFGDLKKMHEYLVNLPQNDAYKNFNTLTPQYQSALRTFFSPKYTQEDKGFVGNILRSLKSSATYAGQTFAEIGMQIAGLPVTPTTNLNPAEEWLTLTKSLNFSQPSTRASWPTATLKVSSPCATRWTTSLPRTAFIFATLRKSPLSLN